MLKKQNTAKIRRKKSCTRKPKKKGRSLTEKTIENENEARTKPRFYRTVAPEKKVKLGVPRMTRTRPLRHIRFFEQKRGATCRRQEVLWNADIRCCTAEEHEIFWENIVVVLFVVVCFWACNNVSEISGVVCCSFCILRKHEDELRKVNPPKTNDESEMLRGASFTANQKRRRMKAII